MPKLTALSVKAAKEPGRYGDGNGLMLYVQKSGARSWVLRIQVNGKRRDFGLGSHPEVSLADAREKASEIRKLCRSGIDPVAYKNKLREDQQVIPTFKQAATDVYEEHKASWRNTKHKAQWISSLQRYAFPSLGQLTVDQIEAPQIRDMLMAIWLDKPETARRVRQRVATVLDWSYAKGYRTSEAPLRSINKGLPRQPKTERHFDAMPYPDVPALMADLVANESIGRLALQFLILTAARSGEVRGAEWSEVADDFSTWTVPASKMKANKDHIVPLSEAAQAVLKKMTHMRTNKGDCLLFPGLRSKKMSDMTLSKALRSITTAKATVHGFRSSFRDWAAETTNFQGDVVEAALAHSIKNKVEAAYRRTNYLEKRRLLMNAWASYLMASVADVILLTTSKKFS
jgi:integrase